MSERTADMFKGQSEEEIMNWMVANMPPEQIKSCFEIPLGEEPGEPGPVVAEQESDINRIRRLCAGKKYIINEIVDGPDGPIVNYWYYDSNIETWKYFSQSLRGFPSTVEEADSDTKECGPSQVMTPTVFNQTIEKLKLTLDGSPGELDDLNFAIAARGAAPPAAEKPGMTTITVLQEALKFQKDVDGLMSGLENGQLSDIFIAAPVLIESITPETFTVSYYYLVNLEGDIKFIHATLPIDDIKADFQEIVNDFKKNIDIAPEGIPVAAGAGGSEGVAKTVKTKEEWKDAIREAASKIDQGDLIRIKQIYTTYPLSGSSAFFMENLFPGIQFGSSQNLDLENYVKMKFGAVTDSMFRAKLVTNSFGTQSIFLEAK